MYVKARTTVLPNVDHGYAMYKNFELETNYYMEAYLGPQYVGKGASIKYVLTEEGGDGTQKRT